MTEVDPRNDSKKVWVRAEKYFLCRLEESSKNKLSQKKIIEASRMSNRWQLEKSIFVCGRRTSEFLICTRLSGIPAHELFMNEMDSGKKTFSSCQWEVKGYLLSKIYFIRILIFALENENKHKKNIRSEIDQRLENY